MVIVGLSTNNKANMMLCFYPYTRHSSTYSIIYYHNSWVIFIHVCRIFLCRVLSPTFPLFHSFFPPFHSLSFFLSFYRSFYLSLFLSLFLFSFFLFFLLLSFLLYLMYIFCFTSFCFFTVSLFLFVFLVLFPSPLSLLVCFFLSFNLL